MQLQDAVKIIKSHCELILHSTDEGICLMDIEGRIIFANPASERMTGYRAEELIGKDMHSLLHHTKPDGTIHPREECPMYSAVKDGRACHNDTEIFWRKDGSSFPVDYTSAPMRDEQGELLAAVVIYRDISDRKKNEETITHLAAIVESSDDAIIGKTMNGIITSWNSGAERLYGYTKDEVIGRSISLLMPSGSTDEPPFLLDQIGEGKRLNHYETLRMKKDGSIIDVSLTISPVKDPNGKIIGASAIARDITEHKKSEKLLRVMSTTDSLTDLANRREFDSFLDKEWRRAIRNEQSITIMMIDIDFFKNYNDTYGHLAGDECLKQVAKVLMHFTLRPGDLAARFGGEEFVIVSPSPIDREKSTKYAEKIRLAVEGLKIKHEQSEISNFVTVSIGGTSLIPRKQLSLVDFIRYADEALYIAKKQGRNRVVFAQRFPSA